MFSHLLTLTCIGTQQVYNKLQFFGIWLNSASLQIGGEVDIVDLVLHTRHLAEIAAAPLPLWWFIRLSAVI